MDDRTNYVIFLVLARNVNLGPNDMPEMAVPRRLRLLETAAYSHKQKILNDDSKAVVEVVYIVSKKQFIRAWNRLANHTIPLKGVVIFADHTPPSGINGQHGLIFSAPARCRECGHTIGASGDACDSCDYLSSQWKVKNRVVRTEVVHRVSGGLYKYNSNDPEIRIKPAHLLKSAHFIQSIIHGWRPDSNLVRNSKYWFPRNPIFLFHTAEGAGDEYCLSCGGPLKISDSIEVDSSGIHSTCGNPISGPPPGKNWAKSGAILWPPNKSNESVTVFDFNVRKWVSGLTVDGNHSSSSTEIAVNGNPTTKLRVGYKMYSGPFWKYIGDISKLSNSSITLSKAVGRTLADGDSLYHKASPTRYLVEYQKVGKFGESQHSGGSSILNRRTHSSTWGYSTDSDGIVTFSITDSGQGYRVGDRLFLHPTSSGKNRQCCVEVTEVGPQGQIVDWKSNSSAPPFQIRNPYVPDRVRLKRSNGQPHFWYCPYTRQLCQSIGMNWHSTALAQHPEGTSNSGPASSITQRGPTIQVEIGTNLEFTQFWSDEWLMNIAEDLVAPVELYANNPRNYPGAASASILEGHHACGILAHTDKKTQARLGYGTRADNKKNEKLKWRRFPDYRDRGKSSTEYWHQYRGTVGHVNVPQNDHYDPGSLNTVQICAYAEDIVDLAQGRQVEGNILNGDEMKRLAPLNWAISNSVVSLGTVNIELFGSYTANPSQSWVFMKFCPLWKILFSQRNSLADLEAHGDQGECKFSQSESMFIDCEGVSQTPGTQYDLNRESYNRDRDLSLSRPSAAASDKQYGVFYGSFADSGSRNSRCSAIKAAGNMVMPNHRFLVERNEE